MEISTREDKKEPSQRNYKFLMIITMVSIFACLAIFLIILQTYYPTDSEIVIRKAAAESLNIDPNEFNRRDYAKVTRLDLSGKELSDIRFVTKFKNLSYLKLGDLIITHTETPKLKMALQKLHIIKPRLIPIPNPKPTTRPIIIVSTGDATGMQRMSQQRQTLENISKGDLIDLSPLGKLKKLQTLDLGNRTSPKEWVLPLSDMFSGLIPFQNIESLSGLKNLKQLNLSNTLISDLEPLKHFKNLQHLSLSKTEVNDLGPLKDLTNLKTLFINNTQVTNLEPIRGLVSLRDLYLSGTQVTSLEPLRGLTNLRELEIDRTQISDLEPIIGLKYLEYLWMYQCENITDEQVEDLQNALPNLKIYRHLNLYN